MQQKFWLILLLSLFDNFYKFQIGTDATGAGQKSTVKTGGHGRKHHRSTPTGDIYL